MEEIIKPILSVITVTYNSAEDIEKTIANICAFVSPTVEYIIIDGNSTDGTKEIIQKYGGKISKWISEKDNGIYDAMNKGIKMASGTWCIFINSGDTLLHIPDQLFDETVASYSAIAAAVETDRDGIVQPVYNWSIKLHNTLPHQGIFYNIRKEQISFDTQYRIFADYDLNLRLFLRKKKIIIIDEVVAFHSLIGVSNSDFARKEALEVLKNNCGRFYVFLSWIYRHFLGLKQRVKNV